MNYKIIEDEKILDEFIDWLPELNDSEVFYTQLFGRKKYLEKGHIQSGYQSLNRFVCKKERLKEKIRQLEIPLGRYKNRDIELPQECLAIYICPNPRSQEIAAKNLLKTLAEKVTKKYEGYNVYQLAMTETHKAKNRTFVVDFDFDDVDYKDLEDKILPILDEDSFRVVKTRSGFHLLVMPDKVNKTKKWYEKLKELGPDVVGDSLLPIPGTLCGGKLITFEK